MRNKEPLALRHGQKVFEKDGQTYIKGVCEISKEEIIVGPVDRVGLIEWLHGTPIQIALPGLPADDREFLISGISGEAYDNMFKPDDDNLGS